MDVLKKRLSQLDDHLKLAEKRGSPVTHLDDPAHYSRFSLPPNSSFFSNGIPFWRLPFADALYECEVFQVTHPFYGMIEYLESQSAATFRGILQESEGAERVLEAFEVRDSLLWNL